MEAKSKKEAEERKLKEEMERKKEKERQQREEEEARCQVLLNLSLYVTDSGQNSMFYESFLNLVLILAGK